MKAVTQLDKEFPRIEIVRAAEGEAVVEKHAAVGDVDGLEIDGEALAEFPAERQIKGCVRLKVVTGGHLRRTAIGEAGGVENVCSRGNMPRQGELPADV